MRIEAMANKQGRNVIVPADQVDEDDVEHIDDDNVEVLGEGAEVAPEEDFTEEVKNVSDTDEAHAAICKALKQNGYEGRRLAMVGGAITVLCVMRTGDIGYVDEFLDSVGEGARRNAWRIWFERMGPVVWDRNREVDNGKGKMVKKAGFVLSTPRRNELNDARRKSKATFDTGLLKLTPWKLTPEAQYKGMDIHKSIRGILAQAKRQVDPEYLKRTKASEDDLKLNDFEGLNELQMLDRMLSERKAKAAAAQQNGSQAVH
jgi:hypothetical protein